ncbi:Hypothetical predicted protein [Paramuricea clavata]|uniref:Uncharacterized protein n=1 Tax=Paramuricea clavata TaxID=317549 RepID=A0A7D9IS39_PARCT|nr:Hypothetical predicted protein [Paramuricea clavata]
MEQGVGTERVLESWLANSCGVGILLRDPDRFKHCTYRCDAVGRIISLDCTFNSQDLRFINIYAPTDGTKRIEFFQSLDTHFVSHRRFIIGGDFNCMLELAKDKYGGNPASGDTGVLHLKKLIQRFDLVDIWQFTWQTKRGSIKCRLDRFYFSSSLVRDYDVETDITIYPYSDHDFVRVLLTVDKASSNVGPGVWKLNVSLLQVQEVREQIASFWEHWKDRKSDFGNVAEWWDYGKLRVKSLFLKYSHKASRKRKQERATILNRYRRIVCKTNLSEDEVKELDLVKSQMETEKRRAVKKTCHALRTSDGRRGTEQDDISKEQVRFYKELYSKVPTDKVAQDRLLNLLDRKLTNEQRDSCEGQLTVGECLVAVESMANVKTPGSDGLPKEFYLSFWDLLKEDFVEMANYCFFS